MYCSMRRAVASALSDCVSESNCVISRYMNHVSSPPLTASTSTTSPTKETTYLPNRLLRRNQLLRTASMSPPDAGAVGDDGPDLVTITERAAGIGHDQVTLAKAV